MNLIIIHRLHTLDKIMHSFQKNNTMTYLTWCAEVQICLTIFRTFYFFLTELLWDHKFFPNVTGCQKTQASDCNKFHCINPYLLILISKATPVSACIGRCSNRITVSFNATFTLLKTEVKQKFDEAPDYWADDTLRD
jgi:hypothetical protein